MSIRNGMPSIRRVHGGNFIQEQAQKRLDEAVAPHQRKGLNALDVDAHEALLYLKKPSARVCTCRQVQKDVVEMGVKSEEAPKYKGISREEEVTIDWNAPLFGEPHEANFPEDASYNEYDFDTPVSEITPSVIESSPDCGICYRTGFVPGFEQYGQQRHVFTSHDMVDARGYTTDRSLTPHTFFRLDRNGEIVFVIPVPKYFAHAQVSVRNNYALLKDEQVFFQGTPLSLTHLKQNAGKPIAVSVRAEVFTHLVVVFDLGGDPLHVNVAQLAKVTDWTLFETIGNLNVVLPMTIPELPVGSVIVLPSKRMALRTTDVPNMRTAKGRNINWTCTTRVLQPQEALKSIHFGVKIY